LKKSCWTSVQLGAWTMIQARPPTTMTVLMTAVAVARQAVPDRRRTSDAGETGGTDGGPPAVTCGPPGWSWRRYGSTDDGYGVKTGAATLSDNHSFWMAASDPSAVIAAIAALTQGVIGLPLARTTLTCSPLTASAALN
jgi:hypothetical protein